MRLLLLGFLPHVGYGVAVVSCPVWGVSGILSISGPSDLREPSCCAFVLPPCDCIWCAELPSGLWLWAECWHLCLLYSAEWCRAWCWAFLSSCRLRVVCCARPGFFSHSSSSLIYRCPHFMFLSKLGTCLAILSMQLLSVLIQPQPPATLPSVHGWVSTLSFFLVGHMALGGSFHQRLELWWGCAAGRSAV